MLPLSILAPDSAQAGGFLAPKLPVTQARLSEMLQAVKGNTSFSGRVRLHLLLVSGLRLLPGGGSHVASEQMRL